MKDDILDLVYQRPIKVAVVEDSTVFMERIKECLAGIYEVTGFSSAEDALATFGTTSFDLILLDVILPGMSGIQALPVMRSITGYSSIPVIMLTSLEDMESKKKAFVAGAADYIVKPYQEEEVRLRVRNHLRLASTMQYLALQKKILEEHVHRQADEIIRTRDASIAALASLAETRDNETGLHIMRTMQYMELLLKGMERDPALKGEISNLDTGLIVKTAPLHDIGKVGVPDSILLKNGPLTREERRQMEWHTILGLEALEKAEKLTGYSTFLEHGKHMCASHHEKWDGSGYPRGLAGKSIPIEGRLMAICDVYDALVSKRVYKPPFTHVKAVRIMSEGRGTLFDPDLLDLFLDHAEQYRNIASKNMDSDEEREVLMRNTEE